METQNAIKLIKELKANKFLPKFNVKRISSDFVGHRTSRSMPRDLVGVSANQRNNEVDKTFCLLLIYIVMRALTERIKVKQQGSL